MPSVAKTEWSLTFSKGRIMSTPKINGKDASVEIAVGINSDRLININLVNRQNKWFIASL